MSKKLRRLQQSPSYINSRSILRCERLEDRLAFSTSSVLLPGFGIAGTTGVGGIVGPAVVDTKLIDDQTSDASEMGIVEEQETTPSAYDPDFDGDLTWEINDEWLTEDDQIVWYMPWFGDESDEFGHLFSTCGVSEEFGDVLPWQFDLTTFSDTSDFPVYYFNGWTDDELGTLFPQPVSEDSIYYSFDDMTMDFISVTLWEEGGADIPIYGLDGSINISILSTATTRANWPLSNLSIVPTPSGNHLDTVNPSVVPQFWLAFAPESTGLQFYMPPVISTSDSTEEKEQPFTAEVM
jgi:hypothetical protein